jgi:hypothetical protein
VHLDGDDEGRGGGEAVARGAKKRWGCGKMAKNMFVWGNVGKDMWKIVANNYWTISGHAGENQKQVMMGKKNNIYIYKYIVRIPEIDGKQERGGEREREIK